MNTFPHSTGIASSASAMSALAGALVEIDEKINGPMENKLIKISRVARLLSGSASRSIYPIASAWGEADEFMGINFYDDYAVGVEKIIDKKFINLKNAILIVDSNEKAVSSSVGHELMNKHPHRTSRIFHAKENFKLLLDSLRSGDFLAFSRICEVEALDLHAMMMTSNPSFILIRPNSLAIIEEIKKYRAQNEKVEMAFTIDAGPNIHLLYTKESQAIVEKFIQENLVSKNLVQNVIYDEVGEGLKVY